MRNRSFEGRDHDEHPFTDHPRGYTEEHSPGHERGFGLANGNGRGFERDPHRVDHRVDDRRYGGREDGMWSRYDYGNERGQSLHTGGFDPSYDRYGESRNEFGARTSGYAPAHFERARGEERPSQGRLPKGYVRSDERIREDVCERLGMEVDASEVEVHVDGGVVSLTGSVLDRQTKYQLEEISERVLGVKDVQNHVTILRGAGNSLATTQRMDVGRDGEPQRRTRH